MKNMQHLVRSSFFTAASWKKIFCAVSTNDPFLNNNEITHLIYKLTIDLGIKTSNQHVYLLSHLELTAK